MIIPTVIILIKLLFVDGTSHPVKATSGSLVVSGCGCRYGNSAQCFTALHFPSLHAGAVPHGGIFTPVDMCRYIHVLYPFCSFFPVLQGTRQRPPNRIRRASPLGCMRISIVHSMYWICQKGGARNRYREGADIGSRIRGSYYFIIFLNSSTDNPASTNILLTTFGCRIFPL
ncbi:MAG: hypothetical protein MPEBLZ_00187 [Candidatus Methanoperedens nitroreducens]|uniref:Uncharacterized protein n=1 Tax=Candidatus Methanoperedens nitratireducens TaxID=1392998 RepID=A0A0P7ZLY1_9EURY|nr:MAG: hypothetical protein MPEBLZ_00187 [Candidatus Methanoperedens sp. BLZ1]